MVVFTDIKFGYNLHLPWIRSNFEIIGKGYAILFFAEKGYTIHTITNGAMIYYDFDVDDI